MRKWWEMTMRIVAMLVVIDIEVVMQDLQLSKAGGRRRIRTV